MTRDAPLIWCLEGVHGGDNQQLRALSAACGGHVVLKPLGFNGLYPIPNWALGATLKTLRPEARAMIAPPWPDLVIAAGRRSVAVALYIRKTSAGRAKLVHIGRPRAPLHWFDLVVTTPQYGLPPAPNVLHLMLPFTPSLSEVSSETLKYWSRRFTHLPRPWTALLVGGRRWPFRLDKATAALLARKACRFVEVRSGSLLVSTSPRTAKAVGVALKGAIDQPAHIHLWDGGVDNPYRAFLALADDFIVTGDSVSMLADACRTLKPVRIAALPRIIPRSYLGGAVVGPWMAHHGVLTPPRCVERVHDRLIDGGHAIYLGAPEPPSWRPVGDETALIMRRIRALLDGEG